MDSGDSPQMDTTVPGIQKDIKECINDIEKYGMAWVQATADARDQLFKAKSKKISQLLSNSRDSLIRSLRERVELDRALKDADIEQKTARLNSVLTRQDKTLMWSSSELKDCVNKEHS